MYLVYGIGHVSPMAVKRRIYRNISKTAIIHCNLNLLNTKKYLWDGHAMMQTLIQRTDFILLNFSELTLYYDDYEAMYIVFNKMGVSFKITLSQADTNYPVSSGHN